MSPHYERRVRPSVRKTSSRTTAQPRARRWLSISFMSRRSPRRRSGELARSPLRRSARRRSRTTSTEELPVNARFAYSKSFCRSRATTTICLGACPEASSRPFESAVQLFGNGWNWGRTFSGPWSRNLERSTQVSPPHAGHDETPISKHASQSRHNARRRSGRCSDGAVLRVWRMWTRALSDLIANRPGEGQIGCHASSFAETKTYCRVMRETRS